MIILTSPRLYNVPVSVDESEACELLVPATKNQRMGETNTSVYSKPLRNFLPKTFFG